MKYFTTPQYEISKALKTPVFEAFEINSTSKTLLQSAKT
jgi:hypothetical protein